MQVHNVHNYVQLVETLVIDYGKVGCGISLKLYILDARFKRNMEQCSEEHDKSFHQDMMAFERRLPGQYNEGLMGD